MYLNKKGSNHDTKCLAAKMSFGTFYKRRWSVEDQTEIGYQRAQELFEELRRDFPQAKIITLSMSELLAAAQESDQSEEE